MELRHNHPRKSLPDEYLANFVVEYRPNHHPTQSACRYKQSIFSPPITHPEDSPFDEEVEGSNTICPHRKAVELANVDVVGCVQTYDAG